ncbi:MAG TPA: hypothetical protein VN688_30440 [Gemmataceae bacterium]|nr:hypothetical protein [Gemmataceae bacterium]
MLPSTTARVPLHTSACSNEAIHRQTEEKVAQVAAAGSEAIERRLRELDREWDIERSLEANAASVGLIGLGLGAFVSRRFYILPGLVCGFLLQHALQGWCPPVPIFRRLGFRTASEIDHERYALKALRGDFRPSSEENGGRMDTHQALEAARR